MDDFQKIEMRVGRVLAVEDFPEARNPSYKLIIDFGAFGTRRSSAAVRRWYEKDDLVGRLVVGARVPDAARARIRRHDDCDRRLPRNRRAVRRRRAAAPRPAGAAFRDALARSLVTMIR